MHSGKTHGDLRYRPRSYCRQSHTATLLAADDAHARPRAFAPITPSRSSRGRRTVSRITAFTVVVLCRHVYSANPVSSHRLNRTIFNRFANKLFCRHMYVIFTFLNLLKNNR